MGNEGPFICDPLTVAMETQHIARLWLVDPDKTRFNVFIIFVADKWMGIVLVGHVKSLYVMATICEG